MPDKPPHFQLVTSQVLLTPEQSAIALEIQIALCEARDEALAKLTRSGLSTADIRHVVNILLKNLILI